MLLLQTTGISLATVSLHLNTLSTVIRSAKREQLIPISERKVDFQSATGIHTYGRLNKFEVRIGEINMYWSSSFSLGSGMDRTAGEVQKNSGKGTRPIFCNSKRSSYFNKVFSYPFWSVSKLILLHDPFLVKTRVDGMHLFLHLCVLCRFFEHLIELPSNLWWR